MSLMISNWISSLSLQLLVVEAISDLVVKRSRMTSPEGVTPRCYPCERVLWWLNPERLSRQ